MARKSNIHVLLSETAVEEAKNGQQPSASQALMRIVIQMGLKIGALPEVVGNTRW